MVKNLQHTKGDTFFKSMAFKTADWTAIDLTGATIKLGVKEKVEDTAYIIQETATITDAVNWLAEFNISSATMTIAVENYYYDMEYTTSSGIVATFLKWFLVINYEIS